MSQVSADPLNQAAPPHPILESFLQLLPLLHTLLPDVSLGITDTSKWLAYYPGSRIDVGAKAGTPIHSEEPLYRCIHDQVIINEQVPEQFFGIAFHGLAVPILNEGVTIGALAAQNQGHNEKELLQISEQIVESISQANQGVSQVAEGAEGLAHISGNLLDISRQASLQMNDTHEVITFIKGIADQTHLLGLNAAIEAARAGDMGSGFGVVASEIRKLSHETIASADRIQQTLHNMRKTMDELVVSIEKVVEVGNSQADSSEQVSSFIGDIEQMSRKLNSYAINLQAK
ncbi:methyl-accepting chemotaxis protein [Paenibacillus sp. JX-17]|uniref:Methyl-accepting chemotaxis protein n=1 Tax=Paenibacillus lacisoli TaxID=3064525 RepID=A0ABT9CEQ0_9BACL|nr:methyl-accepting chemotaxis protein [Paenibacillus sp. JX-17]MDO7907345.1 methyl-accepting chemotaxis protein [Paenibacillus sp. JX-17]